MAIISKLISPILLAMIHAYRYAIKPFLGSCCRFEPSCSTYALETIRMHGCLKGSYYTARRLSRCHPWHAGGIDPIP